MFAHSVTVVIYTQMFRCGAIKEIARLSWRRSILAGTAARIVIPREYDLGQHSRRDFDKRVQQVLPVATGHP
jgi:hypothetical protein